MTLMNVLGALCTAHVCSAVAGVLTWVGGVAGVQFAVNPRMSCQSWNVATSKWLRRYTHTHVHTHTHESKHPVSGPNQSLMIFSLISYPCSIAPCCVCRVCFERVTWQPTLVTFTFCALWHGFYLKYYMVAVMVTLVVEAARKVSIVHTYIQIQ